MMNVWLEELVRFPDVGDGDGGTPVRGIWSHSDTSSFILSGVGWFGFGPGGVHNGVQSFSLPALVWTTIVVAGSVNGTYYSVVWRVIQPRRASSRAFQKAYRV